MDDGRLRKLKLDLRAMLQSAGRRGLTLEEVERDYEDLFQTELPWRDFNALTLPEFLENLSDTIAMLPGDGRSRPDLYYATPDSSTFHLEELIERQRVRPPTRFGGTVAETCIDKNDPRLGYRNNQQVLASITNSQLPQQPQAPIGAAGYRVGPGYTSVTRENDDNQLEHVDMEALRQTLSQRLTALSKSGGASAGQQLQQASFMTRQNPIGDPVTQIQPPPSFNASQRMMANEGLQLLESLRQLNMKKESGYQTQPIQNQPFSISGGYGIRIGTHPPICRVPAPAPVPVAVNLPGPAIRLPYSAFSQLNIRLPAVTNRVISNSSDFSCDQPSVSMKRLVTDTAPASLTQSIALSAVESDADIPAGAEASARSMAIGQGDRQRRDSGSSISTSAVSRMPEFPEEAPILLPSQLPCGVKIPRKLWETIYAILRSCGNGTEWMDIRQFQSEYARRTQKPISTEYLKKTCGIASFKQMFVDIPYIEIMHSPDEAMYVRLRQFTMAKKCSSMYDVKPRYRSVRPQTAGGVAIPRTGKDEVVVLVDDEETLMIPRAPCVNPNANRSLDSVPQVVRSQIYHLLWHYFRGGIDISTFCETYTKRYGTPLNTQRDCNMSLARTLYSIPDLIDVGKADDGKIWLRPVPYEKVRELYDQEKKEKQERVALGLAVEEEEPCPEDEYFNGTMK